MEQFVPNTDKVAAYFASINRSAGERAYALKTMPRVSGAGTRVVITEYDLPNQEIQPHDVMVDADGIVWHSDFSGQTLGRFDPRTLAYKAYPVPLQRSGWPTGALDLEVDPQGNLWLGLMFQAGMAKFDRASEQFQTWQLPTNLLKNDSQQAMVGVQHWTVDNNIWMQEPSAPARAAAGSTTRGGCGSPNSPRSASACSTPRPRNSRSGRCRASSSRPMTQRSTRTATSGPPA